eukprot:TRINITY_DN467_c0_g1_i2.p1 TRINITY_DN467_c0_g1~~TRINITY_DN467_c0_g1_i2.p1  ORF type:complete len:472 (+),score=49.63 TRINITY_DN467_c0_g1_i2:26-1417(+)
MDFRQNFEYLVIIDFEATCDEGPNPAVTRENQEIIEFPWMVADLDSGKVVDQKQLFVKPEWSKELTTFCKNLTGITDDMLRGAPHLEEVIKQFDNYVYSNFINNNKSFCLLTDGPWDLKHCLRNEANSKKIKLASHYATFFDLRVEFGKCYPDAPAVTGLKSMATYLGISIEGRRHCGIDDCRTISNILGKMVKDGHTFQNPEHIPQMSLIATEPQVGGGGGGYKDFDLVSSSHHHVGGSYCQGPSNYVARLRGLPWQATETDICDFFSGLEVLPNGVHISLNFSGRPTGDAYVEFPSEKELTLALDRNRQTLGHRYIEVFKSTPLEMSKFMGRKTGSSSSSSSGTSSLSSLSSSSGVNSLDSSVKRDRKTGSPIISGGGLTLGGSGHGHQSANDNNNVVRMRGLPFSASESDIAEFFAGLCRVRFGGAGQEQPQTSQGTHRHPLHRTVPQHQCRPLPSTLSN